MLLNKIKFNLTQNFRQNILLHYAIIILLCIIILIPSFKNGFFGDDYSWLLQAKESSLKKVGVIFFEPAPYEYFRPIPKVIFAVLWNIFPLSPIEKEGNIFYYRFLVLLINILTTIILYNLISQKFNKSIAFITACFFSVISCHSEALYSINCLNELLSALFILLGLFLFVKSKHFISAKIFFSIICFLLAVLSRESAFCFIFLLFLFDYSPKYQGEKSSVNFSQKIVIILVVSLLYIILRLISYHYYFELYSSGNYGIIDTNIFRYFYKIFHYFINIIFPVKTIFYIIGFENYEKLRNAFLNPADNIKLFSFLVFSSIIILSILIFLFKVLFKPQKLPKDNLLGSNYFSFVFPFLFTLFALIVYLPLNGTAERFLYLPSIGICLLFAVFAERFFEGYKKASSKAVVILVVFILIFIYSASMYQRAFMWRETSLRTKHLLIKLEEKINNSIFESQNQNFEINNKKTLNILLLDIPTIEKGTYFVNQYNFNHIWKFYYPKENVRFWFYNKPDNLEVDLTFSINELKE